MREYVIVTDSGADLAPGFCVQHGIVELELTYNMGSTSYRCNDPVYTREEFYGQMRAGQMPKTAAVNTEEARTHLEAIVQSGKDVLCVIFSAALSSSYSNVHLSALELVERYPACRIEVVDSLCASSGQGMLVKRALDYQKQGLSVEENARALTKDRAHIGHLITVQDLFHLHRGGRVSAASAVVGSVLGIKPLLHVDESGRLIAIGKIRGRRQALLSLVSEMEKLYDPALCSHVVISHGDCLADAQFVSAEIEKRLHLPTEELVTIGPMIGAHAGPDTIALFFYARNR